ncbi:MAG: lasso peptide biosynthesis B2 protein [Burkholderiales bacterium]|nr:lasso peptide biosynthesis B2 protein [Burkholderiales bacterium]
MRQLRKFFALNPAGRTIVLHSFLLLPMVALSLRAFGMARTRAMLGRLGPRADGAATALAPLELARLVDAVAALLRVRCLARSLALWQLLRNRGTSTEVRLGVSKLADGGLTAHAWIEYEGLPLNDHTDVLERYAALPTRATQTSC